MEDKDDRKMYKATCSKCGEETEVPFEPDPSRPVYCKNCYRPKKRYDDRGPRNRDY